LQNWRLQLFQTERLQWLLFQTLLPYVTEQPNCRCCGQCRKYWFRVIRKSWDYWFDIVDICNFQIPSLRTLDSLLYGLFWAMWRWWWWVTIIPRYVFVIILYNIKNINLLWKEIHLTMIRRYSNVAIYFCSHSINRYFLFKFSPRTKMTE
jgi:hypothetical protein